MANKDDEGIDLHRAELNEAYEALGALLFNLNATNEQCALVFNTIGLAEFIGSLEGVRATKGHTPLKAVSGRIAIGEASRKRISEAVEPYRHMTKQNAAITIAGVVALDTGTVLRHLCVMYPGSKWKNMGIPDDRDRSFRGIVTDDSVLS